MSPVRAPIARGAPLLSTHRDDVNLSGPLMTPAARVAAAIEILGDMETRHRPASEALRDWGLSHRFAGSGDRAAIGALVYDALRNRAVAALRAGHDTPRAWVLGTLAGTRTADDLDSLFSGARHAPEPLSAAERTALAQLATVAEAPWHMRANVPAWLAPALEAAFGSDAEAEGAALSTRAGLDLRANTLKTIRAKTLPALVDYDAEACRWSPEGIRLPPRADGRIRPIQTDPLYLKGMIEIQDEGSQIAARLSLAREGEQVLDLCAGGGGKTLALAALMNNRGQIHATDADPRRLAPIHDRLRRADVRNVQVRTPRGRMPPVDDLAGRMDLVFVDAPCTGSGTWRRNPDAKWRLRPASLAQRRAEQQEVLAQASICVRPGGRLVYVTCSILPEENEAALLPLIASGGWRSRDMVAACAAAGMPALAQHARPTPHGLLLTPATTGTDGFFVAIVEREGA